ncbi:MAG: 3-oxoacyl-[acyl-carrier protein] reductase [Glaciecola sp.]|jgi:3-oxoacyl-[acyl-carrier protein] reductase
MNILITGVSRGIGEELLNLAIKSDNITRIFACTSSGEAFKDNKKVKFLQFNFNEQESIEALAASIDGAEINIMINNAGFLQQQLYKDMTLTDAKKIFDINFWGPYMLIQILLPNLIKGKGHVVNIGSMGGFQGSGKFSGLSVYSASKAALANLTECLAEEHKDHHVSFNCLALGAVDTEMLKKAFPTYKADITPYTMAKFILNFAMNSGSVINGKVIPVSTSTP